MARVPSFLRAGAFSALPFAAAVLATAGATPPGPALVSVADGGGPADARSYEGSPTGSGRFVAFYSSATNLLPGSGNSTYDVFLRDRTLGTTTLVSAATGGGEGNGDSSSPCLSDNGRFVFFQSDATNLVGGDDEGQTDVFLADMSTGTVTRVSESAGGAGGDEASYILGNAVSKNGRYLVFHSVASNLDGDVEDASGQSDIFLRDQATGTTRLVSRNPAGEPADGSSFAPSISPNGRFVTYMSAATDLAGPDPDAENFSIFVYDVKKGTTSRLPLGSPVTGADALSFLPVISDNGRFVAFQSYADNLVAGQVNTDPWQVFLFDRKTGVATMASRSATGDPGDAESTWASISANGKIVTFNSTASNLDAAFQKGDAAHVFLYDVKKGTVRLVSRNASGAAGDADCYGRSSGLSGNGKYISFYSAAGNFESPGMVAGEDTFVVKLGK